MALSAALTAALSAQKAQFSADAATLVDVRLALDLAVLIERWYASAITLATEEANSISSYGLDGRNFSRRQLDEHRTTVDSLRGQIESALFGGGFKVADCRANFDQERG